MKNPIAVSALVVVILLTVYFNLSFNSSSKISQYFPSSQTQMAAVSGAGSGLVAYYNFDNGTAADSSGNSNNGVLIGGPTLTAGKVGAASLLFDGVDDYVNIPHSSSVNIGSGNFAFSFWFKKTNATDSYTSLLSKNTSDDSDGPGFVFFLRETVPNIYAGIGNGSATLGAAGTPINNTDWQHVTVVREQGQKLLVYLNGVVAAQSTVVDTIGDVSNAVGITIGKGAGLNPSGPPHQEYFKGAIDDVRVYNRALTAAEVTEIYNYSGGMVTQPPITPPATDNPPIISSISASSISTTGAIVSYVTDILSTTRVEYGPTTSYGSFTALDSSTVITHSQSVSGLTANTFYHYRVISVSATGKSTTSGDSTFTTQTVTATVPAPTIGTFSASPSSITTGQSTTLSWTSTDATSLSINQGVGAVSGTSKTVSPSVTTTYTLTATNITGTVTKNVTVTVNAVVPPSAPAPIVNNNLLKNSSFEVPGDNFWGFGGSKITESDLAATSTDGKYSLKWPYIHPLMEWPIPNPITGLNFGVLKYQPIVAQQGAQYTFSAYAKRDVNKFGQMQFQIWDSAQRGLLLASSDYLPLTESWKQYSWTTTLPAAQNSKYVVAISFGGEASDARPYPSPPRGSGQVDAIQFEKGSAVTPYSSGSNLDFGLYPLTTGNMFTWGQSVLVDLYAANSDITDWSGTVNVSVEDYFGTLVSSQAVTLSVPAGARVKQTLNFGTNLKGHYRILLSYNNTIVSEKVFSTLPPAKGIAPNQSIYGADAPLTNFGTDLIKRLGMTRIRPHADFGWEYIQATSTDSFVFGALDYGINLAKSKGLQVYGFLYRTPVWALASGTNKENPPAATSTWSRYVSALVARYGNDVKYWEVYNEPCAGIPDGTKYLDLVKTASVAAKAIDSTAKIIGWSHQFGVDGKATCYDAQKTQLIGALDGVSVHYYPGYSPTTGTAVYDTLMANKSLLAGKPLWNTEGGASGGGTFYKTKGDYNPIDSRSVGLQGGTIVTAKTWAQYKAAQVPYYYYWLNFPSPDDHNPGWSYSWTLNEYDSSLKPAAVVTAVSAYFLDGANIVFNKFLFDGSIADEHVTMLHFKKDGTNNIITAWTDQEGQSINLRNAALPSTISVMNIYDMFGKKIASFGGGQRMDFTLTNNPVYIEIIDVSTSLPTTIDRSLFGFGLIASQGSIVIQEQVTGDSDPISVRMFGSGNTQPSTDELLYQKSVPKNTEASYSWDAPVHKADANTLLLYHMDRRAELGETATLIKDFSGHDVNATLNGSTLIYGSEAGKFAGGFKADGSFTSSSIKIPYTSQVNINGLNTLPQFTSNTLRQFTIEMWLKPIPDTTVASQRLFSKGDVNGYSLGTPTATSTFAARIRESTRNVVFQVFDGVTTRQRWSSIPLPGDNVYHHVAFVFDALGPNGSGLQEERHMDIYIDGNLVNGPLTGDYEGGPNPALPIPNFAKANTEDLYLLGYNCCGPTGLYNGTLDEFVMYNRPLVASEIKAHAKLPPGSTYYWYTEMKGIATTVTPTRSSDGSTTQPPPTTFTVTKTTSGTGSGTVTCIPSSCTNNIGSTVTLTATPSVGSIFTGWSGSCTGTAGCTIDRNATANAIFTLTIAAPIVGDLNGDRAVNSLDYALLVSAWNQNNPTCDLNHDGIVNTLDYGIMLQNWTN